MIFRARMVIDGEYQFIPNDSWLSFDQETRKFSGTPSESNTYNIQVLVYDDTGYKADEFELIVETNSEPKLNSPVPAQTIPFNRNQVWKYTVPSNTFNDKEKDQISYPSAKLVVNNNEEDLNQAWESLAFESDKGKLSGTPNTSGNFDIRIYARDKTSGLSHVDL